MIHRSTAQRDVQLTAAPSSSPLLLGLLALCLGGCWAFGGFNDDDDGRRRPSSTSSDGGSNAGGGSAGQCTDAEDCPLGPTRCQERTCNNGKCGFVNSPVLIRCDQEGGNVCDGLGHCVECLSAAECPFEAVCEDNVCIPTRCFNHTQDGDETDVDCGGASCSPCGTAMNCEEPTDCASKICTEGNCVAARCGDGIINGTEQCDGDGQGTGVETATCDLNCTVAFCGDGQVNTTAGEVCDDGNHDNRDDCPDGPAGSCHPATCSDGHLHSMGGGDESDVDCGGSTCLACPAGLLLAEVVASGTAEEFVEIHNPGAAPVSLDHVFLADFANYYRVADGTAVPADDDFVARFPSGRQIAGGGRIVVAIQGAAAFSGTYGFAPDYDLQPGDGGAPAMPGLVGDTVALADGGGVLVLFRWDGRSELCSDLDIYSYGQVGAGIDKTGAGVGSSNYVPDTAVGDQDPAPTVPSGLSAVRCDHTEGTEAESGGNGYSGHDETSENLSATWQTTRYVSPRGDNVCHVFSQSVGGAASDAAFSVTTDGSDNIIVVGTLGGSDLDFGCGALTLTGGSRDAFVAKLSPDGSTCLWSVGARGTDGYDMPLAVVTDGAGDVLVAGHFDSSSLDFGGDSVANTGGRDLFVAKLAGSDGAPLWLINGAGSAGEEVQGIAVARDGSNDVFITGRSASGDFELGSLLGNPAPGTDDIFVARLGSALGTVLWSQSFGGPAATDDGGTSVAVDSSNNLLVGGEFASPILNLGGSDLTNTGNLDGFVAKLSGSTGSHLWSTGPAGAGSDRVQSLTFDGSNDVFVAGRFDGATMSWGTSLNNTTPGGGLDDVFVAKLSGSTGGPLWAVSATGDGADRAWSVAANAAGDVVLTGGFGSSSFDFGGTAPALPNTGSNDVWLSKLSGSDGGHLWSMSGQGRTSGSNLFDMGRAACFDSMGNTIATGYFVAEHLSFETGHEMTNGSLDIGDLFLLKVAP